MQKNKPTPFLPHQSFVSDFKSKVLYPVLKEITRDFYFSYLIKNWNTTVVAGSKQYIQEKCKKWGRNSIFMPKAHCKPVYSTWHQEQEGAPFACPRTCTRSTSYLWVYFLVKSFKTIISSPWSLRLSKRCSNNMKAAWGCWK